MACITCEKRPREEISEGKHEEEEGEGEGEENEEVEEMGEDEEEEYIEVREEEEEDEEVEMARKAEYDMYQEVMPLYEYAKPTLKQLDNGWETDGTSCFKGRYIFRRDGRCVVAVDHDIIENKDMIRQLLNYYQDICNSEGFHIENKAPSNYFEYIKVLNYESEDDTVKANIKHNVQLAIDKYNEKYGGQRSLELWKIVSVNVAVEWRHVFYITLLAKEFPSADAETNLYQTRITSCQWDYSCRPPASLVKVHVFRPAQRPKSVSPMDWVFMGRCRALRQFSLKGKYFRGTAEQALAFLESLDMEHVHGCKLTRYSCMLG